VQAHADDLYRYARWLCRDPHRAEDLVQETLLRS
jgi:RNA polymerase sigma-70 factor (ECF subfamily)